MSLIRALRENLNINKNRILWSLSIALILIFFFQIGGTLQVIFLNIFNIDVTNLYDLFMPNQVFERISFFDFVFRFSIVEFILMLLINYVVIYNFLKFKSGFKYYLNLSFSIAICFIFMDFITVLYNNKFDEFIFLANFFSNILGGFFLAVIITIFLWFANKIINPNIKYNFLIKNLFFIALNFLLILMFYFIFINIFQSSLTKIKAEVEPNFTINYITPDNKVNNENNFGFNEGKKSYLKNLEYIGTSNLNINYNYDGDNDFDILFFDGCAEKSTKELINLKTSKLRLPNNNFYNINIKEGLMIFKEGFDDTISTVTFDKFTKLQQIDVSKQKKDKFYVSYFLLNNNKMKILSEKNLDFYRFDVVFMGERGVLDREIFIKNINKKIILKPNKKININDRLICKPVSKINDEILFDSVVATIIFKTSKNIKLTEFGKKSVLSLSDLSGWIKGSNLNADELSSYIDNGKVENISIVGSFKNLYIDNNKMELNTINTLSLTSGSIDLSLNNGILKINADVDAAYFDKDRVSKTRWEKISIYVKGIIAFLGTGLLYLLRRFYIIIKGNEEILKL